ncbi:MAG: MFS transporter [Thermoanaerobaculia bacterium]|nr:MFS transporter [Thermoanaerobaculia bacterium]
MRAFSWLGEVSPAGRRALVAAFAGWTLDAMDFVLYLLAIPALRAEFGLDARQAGLLATVALLSSAVGGVVFGRVADRFGRTRALAITVLVFSFASLGSATAQSAFQLVLWRTLLGLGLGGEWSAGAVLVAESVPAAHRGKAIGLMQSGWAIGYLLATLAAALILPAFGWRALFAFGVAPALLVVWIRRRLEEPAVFLGRDGAPPARTGAVEVRVVPAVELSAWALARPPLLARTVIATTLSAAVMFGYWGLFTWIPSFLAAPAAQGGAGLGLVRSAGWIVPMQIGAFLGYLSFGYAADRFGRRRSFALYLVAAAALVLAYGALVRTPWALLALGPALGFFGHGYFSLFGAQLAELFPTALRGTAQGLCYNAGRALSAFAPATIGALADARGLAAALGVTSAFFVAGALLVRLLPETRGVDLAELDR